MQAYSAISKPRLTVLKGSDHISRGLQAHFIQEETLKLSQLSIDIDMAYTAADFTYEFSSIIRGHHVYRSVWSLMRCWIHLWRSKT